MLLIPKGYRRIWLWKESRKHTEALNLYQFYLKTVTFFKNQILILGRVNYMIKSTVLWVLKKDASLFLTFSFTDSFDCTLNEIV